MAAASGGAAASSATGGARPETPLGTAPLPATDSIALSGALEGGCKGLSTRTGWAVSRPRLTRSVCGRTLLAWLMPISQVENAKNRRGTAMPADLRKSGGATWELDAGTVPKICSPAPPCEHSACVHGCKGRDLERGVYSGWRTTLGLEGRAHGRRPHWVKPQSACDKGSRETTGKCLGNRAPEVGRPDEGAVHACQRPES